MTYMTVGDFLIEVLTSNKKDEAIGLLLDSFKERMSMYTDIIQEKNNHNASATFVNDYLIRSYTKLLNKACDDLLKLAKSLNYKWNTEMLIALGCDPEGNDGICCNVFHMDRDKFLEDYKWAYAGADLTYEDISDTDYPIYDAYRIFMLPREDLLQLRFASPNFAIGKEDIAAAIIKDTCALGFSNEDFEKNRQQELYEQEHPEEDAVDITLNLTSDDEEEPSDNPQYVKDRQMFAYRMEIAYFNNLYDWLTREEKTYDINNKGRI